MLKGFVAAFIVSLVPTLAFAAGTPCDFVERSLEDKQKAALEKAAAVELKVPKADVLLRFKRGTWTILLIDAHAQDKDIPFFFYAYDPLVSDHVAKWSGPLDGHYDFDQLTKTTINSVNGIPQELARCFSYHISVERKAVPAAR